MPSYPQDFVEVQWAREATPGTDLPTTSKIICENFVASPAGAGLYRPKLLRGVLSRNRGGEMLINRGTNITIEGPLTYEQAQHHFGGAIVNVAAPTGSGPYVWTHTRPPSTLPTLTHYTIEQRLTDKVTPIDLAWHYATYQDLEIRFETNDVWKYTANLFARAYQIETLTPAIALPTHEVIQTAGTGIWIDATFAGLGTTQVVGQMLSGRVKFGSGAAARWTLDARADRDWGEHSLGSDRTYVEAELTMRLGAQYTLERIAALAGNMRAVRIRNTSGTKVVTLDLPLKHDNPDLLTMAVDEEEMIVTMSFQETFDGTNLWKAEVTNNVATFT